MSRIDLSDLQDAWAATEAKNLDSVDDGRYTCLVADAQIDMGKDGHTRMLKWKLRIEGPKSIGRYLFRNNLLTLEHKESLSYLKADLVLCGLELEKIDDLNERCEDLVGLRLEVNKKTNGKYENVYLVKRLDGNHAQDSAPRESIPAQSEPTDQIPF